MLFGRLHSGYWITCVATTGAKKEKNEISDEYGGWLNCATRAYMQNNSCDQYFRQEHKPMNR